MEEDSSNGNDKNKSINHNIINKNNTTAIVYISPFPNSRYCTLVSGFAAFNYSSVGVGAASIY